MHNELINGVMCLTLVMMALTFGSSAAAAETGPDDVPAVSVTGTGEVNARPDMAQINVGVVTEDKSASEAMAANNEAMQKLLDVLDDHDIEKKDVQTTNFSVSPQRRHDPRQSSPPRIVGYQVTNQVQVKVRDLDKLGEVLDEVIEQGANQVHGVSFSIAEPQKWMDEAMSKAMKDARRKAELLAKAADAQVGTVLSIDEVGRNDGPRPMGRGMRMEMAAASVPIAAGEQTLTATVHVRYHLVTR